MTTEDQRVFLDELGKRWQKSLDQLLKMAAKSDLDLWYEFHKVIVLRTKKKKTTEPQFVEIIEVRPQNEVLEMMIGRTDRMQVAAQYPCLNIKGKPVLISNAAGEEWGETSMVGLNPMRLYARTADLGRIERKQGLIPMEIEAARSCSCQDPREEDEDGGFISSAHPCFAPELHIALECWMELMADEEQPDTVTKADIIEWIRNHYPGTSKTATQRITLVVTPAARLKQ